MKRRLLALLLALSLLTVPARAAENSMDNFIRNEGSYNGQFSDLQETHHFYENIAALYELGLTMADLDGTEYHIDTTWGDACDGAYHLYFAMTPELSEQLHNKTA